MTAFIAHHISGINFKHAHWDAHIFAEKHQNLWKRIGVMLCKNRHKLTLLEDLQLPRKTYKSSRRLMASAEDLFLVFQRTYQLLQNTYNCFRNCSVALTALRLEDLQMFRKTYTSSRSLISLINCSGILTNCSGTLTNRSGTVTYCYGTLW